MLTSKEETIAVLYLINRIYKDSLNASDVTIHWQGSARELLSTRMSLQNC